MFGTIESTNHGDGTFTYDPNGAFEHLEEGQSATDSFRYTISDGRGGTSTGIVYIFIDGLAEPNQAPQFDEPDYGFNVDEESAEGTYVGTVSATDPDAGDTLTFSGGSSEFNVDSSTGQITIAAGAVLDFETNSSYTFDVTVTDSGGLTDTVSVTISLLDENEAPEFEAELYEFPIYEQSVGGTYVGMVGATDPDAGDTLIYSDNSDEFNVDPETGEITVADGIFLNFEINFSYIFDVTATDAAGLTDTATVTVAFEVNEAPTFINETVEDESYGKVNKPIILPSSLTRGDKLEVPDFGARDPNEGDQLTYVITGGNPDELFRINAATGELYLNKYLPAASQFGLTIEVRDNGNPQMSDSTHVHLKFTTIVGMQADAFAIEGDGGANANAITIEFHRLSSDLSDLDVYFMVEWTFDPEDDYDIEWKPASLDDFIDGDGKTKLQAGKVTISGNDPAIITLKADLFCEGVAEIEGRERFRITLIENPDNPNAYAVPSAPFPVTPGSPVMMDPSRVFDILDGVTLFASYNEDYSGWSDDTSGGNPGIVLNDISQGRIANCWLAAGIGAMAEANWQVIENAITDRGDGTYSVMLYNGAAGLQEFYVNLNTLPGVHHINFSGDTFKDPGNSDHPKTGFVEVWPLVLENALGQLLSGQPAQNNTPNDRLSYSTLSNGTADTVWTALLGVEQGFLLFEGMNDSEILAAIESHLNAGETLVIGTKDDVPFDEETMIIGDHAYVVTGMTTVNGEQAEMQMYNPWGYDASLLMSRFSEVLEAVWWIKFPNP